ncbi:low choriolytic enzyme-like [Chironomus tepperi]|uniref:low choriolytic enzyme-like n=1 Tax=Chironomus tepperi TaxID=113505 RepID=UPI00391F84CA
MKLYFLLFIVSKITSLPVPDDRIVFRDDDDYLVDDSADDIRLDQYERLLTDSNLLKSDNTTKEFLYDEKVPATRLENGQFYQGDIILVQEQLDILKYPDDDDDPFGTRTGVISENYRWPKNKEGKVIVPYKIEEGTYNFVDRIRMYLGMYDLEKYTCVKFKQRENEQDYLFIKAGKGCSSNLGKLGGKQTVTLQRNGCLSRGTIIHELIHALGYDHMHSHSERDKYVDVVWDNIDAKSRKNFDKVNPKKFSNFGTKYDFYSVMHYSPTAFSKTGKRTLVPKDSRYRNVIGQRVSLSVGDAERINNMYKCK